MFVSLPNICPSILETARPNDGKTGRWLSPWAAHIDCIAGSHLGHVTAGAKRRQLGLGCSWGLGLGEGEPARKERS